MVTGRLADAKTKGSEVWKRETCVEEALRVDARAGFFRCVRVWAGKRIVSKMKECSSPGSPRSVLIPVASLSLVVYSLFKNPSSSTFGRLTTCASFRRSLRSQSPERSRPIF